MEAFKYQLDLPILFPVLPWVPRRTLHKSKCDLEGPYKVERTSIQPVKIIKVWMDMRNKWKKPFAMTNLWIVVSWPESQRDSPPEVGKAGLIDKDNVNRDQDFFLRTLSNLTLCWILRSWTKSSHKHHLDTTLCVNQIHHALSFLSDPGSILVSKNHWELCQTFQIKPIG